MLVAVVLAKHPLHPACLQALQDSVEPITDSHALAETFATLTGFYKVPTEAATALTLSLKESVHVEPLSEADYDTAISEAPQRGIMGGASTIHSTRLLPGDSAPHPLSPGTRAISPTRRLNFS